MLCRYLSIVIYLVMWGAISSCHAGLFVPGDFATISVHPEAQNQATEEGRTIKSIAVFEDFLYAAYGDSSYDDGPIVVRSANPLTGDWSEPLLTFQTEEISFFREFEGLLYATNYDPLGTPGVNPGGYAVGNGLQHWTQFDNIDPATHVFDVLRATSGDIWMTGSILNRAAIWRSTDGGESFVNERLDSANSANPNAFARYFGVAELNGRIYVQRVDYNAPQVNESLVFDGQTWSVDVDLIPDAPGHVVRPSNFAAGLVYLDHDRIGKNLYYFDGTVAELLLPGPVWDYALSDGVLFVLQENGELLRSLDAANWESLGMAPGDARSLAVLDGRFYLGTLDSRILRSSFGMTVVPEPGNLLGLIYLGMGVFTHYRRRRV